MIAGNLRFTVDILNWAGGIVLARWRFMPLRWPSLKAHPGGVPFMTILAKAAAILAGASPEDLEQMTPVERAKFIDLMREWWQAGLRAQHKLNPNAGAVAARAGEHVLTSK
jgi:hypothetical protein